MPTDNAASGNTLSLAEAGWQIISSAPESREGARRLLVWITKELRFSAVGIHYENPGTAYSWRETAGSGEFSEPLTRPFPESPSYWIIEKDPAVTAYLPLLDLLARQWTFLSSSRIPPATGKRLIHNQTYSGGIDYAWIAISPAARRTLSRIKEYCFSRKPLLLIGENGSGKSYVARMIHEYGAEPLTPFSRIADTLQLKGTLYLKDWSMRSPEEQSAALSGPQRLIAAVDSAGVFNDKLVEIDWQKATTGQGLLLRIPPLRERPEDIPYLAQCLLEEAREEYSIRAPQLSH